MGILSGGRGRRDQRGKFESSSFGCTTTAVVLQVEQCQHIHQRGRVPHSFAPHASTPPNVPETAFLLIGVSVVLNEDCGPTHTQGEEESRPHDEEGDVLVVFTAKARSALPSHESPLPDAARTRLAAATTL